MDDELGERGIERSIVERQILGRGNADADGRIACRSRDDERFGWVDGSHFVRPDASHQLGGQCPGSHPTSRTRWPLRTPASLASCGDSWVEYRPMKRS